jgi:hypothetical protein
LFPDKKCEVYLEVAPSELVLAEKAERDRRKPIEGSMPGRPSKLTHLYSEELTHR